MESAHEGDEVIERTVEENVVVTPEAPVFSSRPEGEATTFTQENPSTSAQEVVDQVHEVQEENSTE